MQLKSVGYVENITMNNINVIAETAWHHEGDVKFLDALLDSLLSTNVDYIKFHLTLDIDEYMDSNHPAYSKLKEWMFTENNWKGFIQKVINGKKTPLFLLNDKASVDLVKLYEPEIIEIHSVCLNDFHLLNKVKETLSITTKIVLGVGGSNLYEIENAISILKMPNIVLMHGFQNYPTECKDINLSKIRKIIRLFPQYEHGYADHCAWNEPNNTLISLLGAAQSMTYLEKHVTINYGIERCDWDSAISIEMLNDLIGKLEILGKCEGNGKLSMNEAEKKYSVYGPMKKAVVAARNLNIGEILSEENVCFKRTTNGNEIAPQDIIGSFGKKVHLDIMKNTVLRKEFFV